MDRREFIKMALLGLVSLKLTGCLPGGPEAGTDKGKTAAPTGHAPSGGGQAAGEPQLVVAGGKDPAELMEKGFNALGGIQNFVKKGNVVVIKPNFSVPRAPEVAATTSIFLVGALVKMCLKAGAKEVKVIDHPFTSAAMCLENTGIRKEVQSAGGNIFALGGDDRFYKDVELSGPTLKTVKFSRDVLEADVFFNFPILKHHSTTRLTMSLKNMMGLVRDRRVFHSTNLSRCIAELAAFKKPHLTIMDATRGIAENGPMGPGTIKENNQVVFGYDPVAIDAYGAQLFGLRPGDVEHLKIAGEMGIGRIDWEKLPLKKV